MKKFKFTIREKQYEVEVVDIDENIAEVIVNGTPFQVEVDKLLSQTKTPKLIRTPAVPSTDSVPQTAKTRNPHEPKGSGFVKSPLPGTILKLHIKTGDMVRIGQQLVTLEAMKMENNINSDKEGIISEIRVKQGDTVMEGDILVVVG
jgi:glutaconyl-CoA/methylmalonyl-CoA decarboxylase subunit gamma